MEDGKTDDKGIQISEKPQKLQAAQSKSPKGMQWEKVTYHVSEPNFKFEVAPNQTLWKHETSPIKPNGT